MKKILTVFCCSLFIQTLLAQVPTNGLVAEYLFSNGTYEDTNPNGYGPNHAVGAAMVSNVEDRFGNANAAKYLLGINYFESKGTYIKLGADAILKPEQATISIWVKLDKISYSGWGYEYNPIILATNNRFPKPPFEGYALYAHMEGKAYAATVQPDPLQKTEIIGGEVAPDTWRHYVITYDDRKLKLYEDGELLRTQARDYRSRELFSNKDVIVGSSMSEMNNRAFHGAVDDIRIYNRVLSDAEVQLLYQESNDKLPLSYVVVSFDAHEGYHQLIDDQLRFQFLQDYATDHGGEIVHYTIYPWNRQNPITGTMILQDKHNYIDIDVSGLGQDSYYTLEFKANQDQKYVLKFKTKE